MSEEEFKELEDIIRKQETEDIEALLKYLRERLVKEVAPIK